MSRIVYRHPSPSRCVVGTVGEPGERAFFIQVLSPTGLNCVLVEKSQVQALVERLQLMIRELRRNKLASLDLLNLPAVRDDAQLEYPITEDFRAGVIAISYEQGKQLIDLQIQGMSEELEELIEEGDEAEADADLGIPDLLVISLSIAHARGFCDRASQVVSSGRTPCPFCGLPLNIDGHVCPRANGYRR
jgi:uncharacterized repeat protein (TIGR03847 family)